MDSEIIEPIRNTVFIKVKELIAKGTDVDYTGEYGGILLIYADNIEMVKFLISKGANVNFNYKKEYDNTPLMKACHYNRMDIAKLLIENGADVNGKNEDKNNSLMSVCMNGYFEIFELLIENGADVNAKNFRGYTALHIACNNEDF